MDGQVGLRRIVPFLRAELRPRGKLVTPFNVVSGAIMLAAAVILTIRFAYGLGSVTNLSQEFPWGIWKGFNVITGVALAGGAYVVAFMVYVLGLDEYRPILRVTVLNGFLAYAFYAGALLLELGRPWHVINPIIGYSFGVSSVLFLVAWHFLLYMIAMFLELSPAFAEWLDLRKAHRYLSAATLGAVIFGITLSTLHQSGLGALFLMAKPKIHPLWYSELIPILFFVSSIFAGLAMVMVEGSISHRVFDRELGPAQKAAHGRILPGLARISAGALFAYLVLLVLAFLHGRDWRYLSGAMGVWYGVEVLGFVAAPLVIFLAALWLDRPRLILPGAVLALLGVVLNRLNVSLIAYKWDALVHYHPTWMEVIVTLAVIAAEIWVFRFIVLRVPVLHDGPAWARTHHRIAGGAVLAR